MLDISNFKDGKVGGRVGCGGEEKLSLLLNLNGFVKFHDNYILFKKPLILISVASELDNSP